MSKVVFSRRVEGGQGRELSLTEFYNSRNTILILRAIGGLGDILMHRMLFEDIKLLMPDCKVHFACPKAYHEAVIDHPYIDEVIDSEKFDKYQYAISYNTSTICGRYELKMAPRSDLHRSDIWATHCGYTLTRHNMHIRLSDEEKQWAKAKIAEIRDRDGPVVILSPTSAMENKNLKMIQLDPLVNGLWDRGLCPIGLHTMHMVDLLKLNVPQISRINIRQWMAIINESDYVISVDTSTFHCAGGLGKPVVGIFTFADGKVYSKHYPTAEVVQGFCPHDMPGCYNWCNCPSKTSGETLPCRFNLNATDILLALDNCVKKHSLI